MHKKNNVRFESTSLHTLSADQKISKFQRILWIMFNVWNNFFPRTCIDKRINECKFLLTKQELDEQWDNIDKAASPSRRLSDLFWMNLPWKNIKEEIESVQVLEVGCGTGIYGQLINKLLGKSFNKYIGVDIEKNEKWAEYSDDSQYSFKVSRGRETYKHLPDSNFIVTQSALEHFEEDLLYFKQVSEYIRKSKNPILQVHLIPSASCITTFPWHGIREYTPRTVSKITRLFGSETEVCLFSLGGNECNSLHRKFITWPNLRYGVDLRYTENQKYEERLRTAIMDDFKGVDKHPAFYALVLASNFQNSVFTDQKV